MAPKKTSLPSPDGKFEGWDQFSKEEQQAINQKSEEILQNLTTEGRTKAAIGRDLLELRKIMLPKRMFVKWLQFKFHMSKATGYRYIEEYEKGKTLLPEPILEKALARNVKLREDVIKRMPPPKTADPEVINDYLDKVVAAPYPQASPRPTDPEVLKKEILNVFGLRYDRLEMSEDEKHEWTSDLIGMMLTRAGITRKTSFAPLDIPAKFQVVRGRPVAPRTEQPQPQAA